MYYFLHIHKTGGSTLQGILNRNFHKQEILDIPRIKSTHIYRDINPELLKGLKMVKGHFLFGIHQLHSGIEAKYITMLREPEIRLVSLYHHLLRVPGLPLHDEIKNRHLSLADFLNEGLMDIADNGMTRFIAGENPSFGMCNEALFEKAKANLDSFFFVGINEKYEESVLLLGKKMNIRFPYYAKANVNKKRSPLSELDHETRLLVDRYSFWDRKLYDYALERFSKELSMYSGDLNGDILKLRKGNVWAERFRKLKGIIRRS